MIKSVSVLQAVRWVVQGKKEIIYKSFRKADTLDENFALVFHEHDNQDQTEL